MHKLGYQQILGLFSLPPEHKPVIFKFFHFQKFCFPLKETYGAQITASTFARNAFQAISNADRLLEISHNLLVTNISMISKREDWIDHGNLV